MYLMGPRSYDRMLEYVIGAWWPGGSYANSSDHCDSMLKVSDEADHNASREVDYSSEPSLGPGLLL